MLAWRDATIGFATRCKEGDEQIYLLARYKGCLERRRFRRAFTSIAATGIAMDALYCKLSKDDPFPEARLPYLGASGTFLPVGLLLYGWTTKYTVFWLVPDIGLFLIGLGILAPLSAIQHHILDCYSSQGHAASVLAAMNVVRFLAGLGFPLFADELYSTLGLGWGNSLLALIAANTGCLSVSL